MTEPKHVNPEEEYFARQNMATLKKLHNEERSKMAQEEKERLKQLHWMHCPKDGSELQQVLFRGVAVDKCFTCGGVFLDNGELEKLAGKESQFVNAVLSLFKYE